MTARTSSLEQTLQATGLSSAVFVHVDEKGYGAEMPVLCGEHRIIATRNLKPREFRW